MAKSGYERLNKTLLWIEGPFWILLKKYWQTGLIIALACLCFILHKQNKKKSGDIEFLKSYLDSSFQQMNEYRDIIGRYHEVARKAIVERDAMKLYADSTAKLLNIKSKQVTDISHTVTKIEIKEKLKVDTQYVDSNKKEIKGYGFTWSDKWMWVIGKIGNVDSIFVGGVDTLNRTDYWKRKKVLGLRIGAKEYYADFNNSNPHIKVTGFKDVSLSQKPKHWSIGPSVQWFYPMKITAGISIQYSIIRF